MLTGNVVLRLEASERYLLSRFDSLAVELLVPDDPLIRHHEICINENQEAIIPFGVYLSDADYEKRAFKTRTGERIANARPMFEAFLTIGPATEVTTIGNPDDAPPVVVDLNIKDDRLVLDLFDSKIIVHLGQHPRAVLEVTDNINGYTIKRGPIREYVHDPLMEL